MNENEELGKALRSLIREELRSVILEAVNTEITEKNVSQDICNEKKDEKQEIITEHKVQLADAEEAKLDVQIAEMENAEAQKKTSEMDHMENKKTSEMDRVENKKTSIQPERTIVSDEHTADDYDLEDYVKIDKVMGSLKKHGELMHEKNKHRIKSCLWCMAIIPLFFLALMFTMETAKVVYLLLWVISLFIFCTYLVVVDYIDDKLKNNLANLGIDVQTDAESETGNNTDKSKIKALFSEVKL